VIHLSFYVDHYSMSPLRSLYVPIVMAKVICVHLVCELGYDMLFQVRSMVNAMSHDVLLLLNVFPRTGIITG
jgi:hypothetical protein